MRIIKRYANRKLYDTTDSSYVTLSDIRKFVQAGEEVQILDNKTKADITGVTFALVIAAELAGGINSNVSELRAIICGGIVIKPKSTVKEIADSIPQDIAKELVEVSTVAGQPLDFGK